MTLRHSLFAALAGVCVLAADDVAYAATVIGATRIEIVGTMATDYVQLSEVQAIEFGSGDNVASAAEGGSAIATSDGFGTVAANAIDGNPDPMSITSFWVPSSAGLAEKYTVTFGGPATLTSLRIVGLGFCCQYRNLWDVTIFDATDTVLFAGRLDALDAPGFDASVTFDRPATGAIPEPTSWVMMILGFGAAGSVIRGRRRAPLPA